MSGLRTALRARARATAVLALALAAGPAAAQEPSEGESEGKAKSLGELIELVRQGSAREMSEARAREKRFREQRDERQQMLAEAKARLARAERRSEELEERFSEGEQQLALREKQLEERLGALGELFGVVRSVAGDASGIAEGSLVSAQYPDRGGFLKELAQSKSLPEMDKLRKLWFLLQQEAALSGKVTRFPATVVTPEGGRVEKDVVRVGAFNAIADGKYLQYVNGSLVELARQPASQHVGTAEDLESARSDLVGFSVDPSRGQILSLLVDVPTFFERINQGKMIGRIIITLAIVGIALALYQWLRLAGIGRRIRADLGSDRPDDGNPLGRIRKVHDASRAENVETLELKLDEAILREVPSLERFLGAVRVLSVVAPLLGLLGTVTGMIQTFQSITLFGTGDPKMMAGGISEALVTTMLGLYAAIPLILLHSVVSGRSRNLVQILESQSAGIVARHAEQQRHAA